MYSGITIPKWVEIKNNIAITSTFGIHAILEL
jgi:hypothetical protein